MVVTLDPPGTTSPTTADTRPRRASLQRQAIGDVFSDGYASIPTNHVTRALLRAIREPDGERGWADAGEGSYPTYRHPTTKGRGAVFVTVRPAGDGDGMGG